MPTVFCIHLTLYHVLHARATLVPVLRPSTVAIGFRLGYSQGVAGSGRLDVSIVVSLEKLGIL
jgi:hypothetical protein